jgi:hypothetical protein
MVWTYGWLVAHHVQETAASAPADAQEGILENKVGSLPTLFLALPVGVLVQRNDLARMPGIDLNPRLSKSNARESCLAQATFCNKL